jgi:replicative DNA helicase
LASTAVRVLTTIRDTGAAADVSALTLGELMEGPEDQPKWVIPDLMEAEDRLMLTGSEGAGKSSLSRQLGIMAAAGIHPFNESMIPPIRAAYVDCENKPRQVRRQVAPLLRWLHDNSTTGVDPMSRVMMDFPGRIDLTRDRDLAAIHRMLDACQPDLLVVGPVYKMSNKSLNDEENAAQFLVALDTIMERGVALIIEAHAGHSTEGVDRKTARRNLRPRGSSSLLGWPEFGLGLRALPRGLADLEPWRGGREQRAWPCRLRRAAGNRWVETSPDDPGRLEPDPPSPFDDIPPDPQGAFL